MPKLPRIEDTNYFTNRTYKNEKGEVIGKLILYRIKGDKEFGYFMICRYCGKESEGKVELNRKPYRIKCVHCGKTTTVEKIKPKKK